MPPASEYRGYVGHPELPDGYYPYLGPRPDQRKDWIATAAVVSGAMLLFPAAIVLGHLGTRAAERGEATLDARARLVLGLGYAAAGVALAAYFVLAARHAVAPETPAFR